MKRVVLALAAALAADAAFGAPMISPKTASSNVAKVTPKKKKKSFRSFMSGSASFLVESAFNGGSSDR
jgi:hypothetical protein